MIGNLFRARARQKRGDCLGASLAILVVSAVMVRGLARHVAQSSGIRIQPCFMA